MLCQSMCVPFPAFFLRGAVAPTGVFRTSHQTATILYFTSNFGRKEPASIPAFQRVAPPEASRAFDGWRSLHNRRVCKITQEIQHASVLFLLGLAVCADGQTEMRNTVTLSEGLAHNVGATCCGGLGPERRRDAHLPGVKRPMLFVQGERDTFGTPAELGPVLTTLTPKPTLHVVAGGDHSLKLSRRDAAAQAAVYDAVQRTIADWIAGLLASQRIE